MPHTTSANQRIFEDVYSAARFRQTLPSSQPVALYFSSLLETFHADDYAQVQTNNCCIIAVVNIERPQSHGHAGPITKWDYSGHVQWLLSHPEVIAVLLRSQHNVKDSIGKGVDLHATGRHNPPDQYLCDAERFTLLQKEFTLLMYALRPKFVLLSGAQTFFNAALFMRLHDIKFPFVKIFDSHLLAERTMLANKINVIGQKEFDRTLASWIHHYGCVRQPYIPIIKQWLGGINYIVHHDRSLEGSQDTVYHMRYFDFQYQYAVEYEYWRHTFRLNLMFNMKDKTKHYRGIRHNFNETDLNSNQSVSRPVATWFTPEMSVHSKASITIGTSKKANSKSNDCTAYTLYTLSGVGRMRLYVIRKSKLEWD